MSILTARQPYKFGLSREEVFKNLGITPENQSLECIETNSSAPIVAPVPTETNQGCDSDQVPPNDGIPSESLPSDNGCVNSQSEQPETSVGDDTASDIAQLAISAKYVTKLRACNINTVEQLLETIGEELDVNKLPITSRTGKATILKEVQEWLKKRKRWKSTKLD